MRILGKEYIPGCIVVHKGKVESVGVVNGLRVYAPSPDHKYFIVIERRCRIERLIERAAHHYPLGRKRRIATEYDVGPPREGPAYGLIRSPSHDDGVAYRERFEALQVIRQVPEQLAISTYGPRFRTECRYEYDGWF